MPFPSLIRCSSCLPAITEDAHSPASDASKYSATNAPLGNDSLLGDRTSKRSRKRYGRGVGTKEMVRMAKGCHRERERGEGGRGELYLTIKEYRASWVLVPSE